jgi:hypothetical protein
MSVEGQSRAFGAPPVNVWVTLDRGHCADTPALLGSAKTDVDFRSSSASNFALVARVPTLKERG